MIDQHFPKTNKLHKIFNRNTVKVSYSCTHNVNQTIRNHNKKLLQQHRNEKAPTETTCNCRQIENCQLKGHCLTKCIVYKATVTETKTNRKHNYVGLTENTFKTRYNHHKSSFKLEHEKASTSLSEHIWALKDKNIDYKIEWQIGLLKKTRPYMPGEKTCPLCLEKKTCYTKKRGSLNVRKEIFSHCAHRRKFWLSNAPQPATLVNTDQPANTDQSAI
ncbi:hypothetical protein ElyMa_004321200 [Elysia marginata]|uniref:GIY-YIG domain-containing protein n=1 Tax=Elysia marginata TaxID=1093978 RepID=A0AAV4H0S0_9GAST|nr:hypothetical protein ElyMa_004321200 [Elysia marginata]